MSNFSWKTLGSEVKDWFIRVQPIGKLRLLGHPVRMLIARCLRYTQGASNPGDEMHSSPEVA